MYRNYRDTFDTVSVINNIAESPTGVNVTVQHPGIKMSYRFFFLSTEFLQFFVAYNVEDTTERSMEHVSFLLFFTG